jgi:hypothetical protein
MMVECREQGHWKNSDSKWFCGIKERVKDWLEKLVR